MAGSITKSEIDDAVRERNVAYLSYLIRSGANLSPEARDHLADVILGLLTGDSQSGCAFRSPEQSGGRLQLGEEGGPDLSDPRFVQSRPPGPGLEDYALPHKYPGTGKGPA
jgi:hypothetical protein